MIPSVLRQLFGDEMIYECRSCGTTLEETDEECPNCGSEEIAEYDLN